MPNQIVNTPPVTPVSPPAVPAPAPQANQAPEPSPNDIAGPSGVGGDIADPGATDPAIGPVGATSPAGAPVERLDGVDITQPVYEALIQQPTETQLSQTPEGIRITHPAGSLQGVEGLKPQIPLEPAKKATLEYDVSFEPGFDFNLGGKMPGLGGGDANRGGTTPDGDGFSARFMFRENGRLVAYVYDMDKKGNWGTDIDTGVVMEPGQKYTIRQHVELNSGSNNDGKLQVWVNGQLVIDRQDMRYVNGDDPKNNVDTLMFHSYYGGNDAEWAARNESTTTIGNIRYKPEPSL